MANKNLIERAFFGKESCLIVTMNNKNDCYFQFGKAQKNSSNSNSSAEGWIWKKVKMNDTELGEILRVLEEKIPKISFFHSFEKNGVSTKTQIWVERMTNGVVAFRVKEAARGLNHGEQQVLIILLKHIILMSSLKI